MESASRWYSSKTLASPPSCRRLSSRWTTSSRRRGSRRNRISMRAVPSSDGLLEGLAAGPVGARGGGARRGVAALAAAGGAHEAPADELLEDLGDEAAGEILGAGDLLDSRRARRLAAGPGDHHRHPIEALLR